jgi:hypothetical protein
LTTIPPPIIEKEERDYITMAALGERWTIVTKAFVEYAGTVSALKVLEQYFHQSGLAFGLKFREMLDVDEKDAERISAILDTCNGCLGRKVTAVWSSPEEVETIISECPFYNSPMEMRMQFEAFANGICEAINPGFEVVHPKAMCSGDAVCRRVVRRKG